MKPDSPGRHHKTRRATPGRIVKINGRYVSVGGCLPVTVRVWDEGISETDASACLEAELTEYTEAQKRLT